MLNGNIHDFVVVSGAPVPKVVGRGHPTGTGRNLNLLKRIKAGECIWEVPRKKMLSIKFSAWRYGIKIKVRRLPKADGRKPFVYAIWKI